MKSVSGYCVRQRRLLSNPVTNMLSYIVDYSYVVKVVGHRIAHANDLNTSSLSTLNRDG